jgi:hypothetical protein
MMKARDFSRAFAAFDWIAVLPVSSPATGTAPPVSEHAEYDGSEKSEGYDGSKHIEPCLQFHHCLHVPDLAGG